MALSCGPGTGSSKGSVIDKDGGAGAAGGAGGSGPGGGSGGGLGLIVTDSGPAVPPPCSGCSDAGPGCGN
jgi:hypothetical protein